MLENRFILLGISTLFAAIPVAIWLYILFKKEEKSKKTVALIFGLGCLTAPALLGMQYLWDIFPQFNLASLIEDNIQTQSRMYIAMFVLFGALEEIIKHFVITSVDKKTVLIKTLDDSIRYSVTAALGFSFTENVYYLYQFWQSISIGQLVGMYAFRSIFTACAHMIFSGVFGYFYGVGKFSISMLKKDKLTGKTNPTAKVISKVFNLPLSQAYQQNMVLRGLTIAVLAHATYNFILQYNIILPVILFVILGYLYLQYLFGRKAGHLILTTDISEKTKSTLAKKNADVVVELLGMWFKEKRYVDVIHIAERLLERDPNNEVVELFKAKALDRLDDADTYKSIIGTVIKTKNDLTNKDKNIISRHIEEKEMKAKVKRMIQKQLEKEGKEFIDHESQNPAKQETSIKKSEGILDEYSKGESFKLNK